MDTARFAALVRALEDRSNRNPRGYRLQVGLLAALGYAYVVAMMALPLAVLAALVYFALQTQGGAFAAVKIGIPALGLAYLLLRALWTRIPPMEGIALPADRYPALWGVIERVRNRAKAPHFRRVLLDGAFNAAVAQQPRFGVVGTSVSDLVIGLPLMQALSAEEFEAVLAHEMGHVSRQHGRFGHWIYRIRVTWDRLATVLEADQSWVTRLLLGRFMCWYAPFFGAYTFVLARQDEYEADAAAARAAGADAIATALARIEVVSRFRSERYWPAISRQTRNHPDLPTPYLSFASSLGGDLDPASAQRWLEAALKRPTDYTDTHPALTDRLRGIGRPPSTAFAPLSGDSAADALFADQWQSLAGELDGRWRSSIESQVAQVRQSHQTALGRLEQLEKDESPGLEAAWERVQLLERLDREAEALAAAEAILAARADHAPALFLVGQARLQGDDPAGIGLLERAASLHPAAAPAAQALIFDYHWRHGRRDEAERARALGELADNRLGAAMRERASLAEPPMFVHHGLQAGEAEALAAALHPITGIRAIYLVRRVVLQLPELPCYFVGIVPRGGWWTFRRSSELEQLRDRVIEGAHWPEGTFFIVSGERKQNRIVRKMRRVPGSDLLAGPASPISAPQVGAEDLERLRYRLARRRVRRRRFTIAGLAVVAVVVLLIYAILQAEKRMIAAVPIRPYSVAQMAERVTNARGRTLVLVLYSGNPSHMDLVRPLREWARPIGPSRVEVFALIIGSRQQAQLYFREAGLKGVTGIVPLWLAPWGAGALRGGLASLGIRIEDTWTIPLVAVVDPGGKVIARWEGETDPSPVIAVAERVLGR